MTEDGVCAADTAQTQSSERRHERGACQRAPLIPLSSSSIRGFLTSGLPKLAVDAGPSYSQHTPTNVRVQKLRAISVRNVGLRFGAMYLGA